MAAATATRNTLTRNISGQKIVSYPVKTSTTVYQGTLVQLAAGRLASAAAGTNRAFAGLAMETKTGNTGGTVYARVAYGMEAKLVGLTALTKGFMKCLVGVSTNQEVTTYTGAGTALARMSGGTFSEWVSANVVWVDVGTDVRKTIVANG